MSDVMTSNLTCVGITSIYKNQPGNFIFIGNNGPLMTIKPDGTLEVDNLKPANETAAEVLKILKQLVLDYMKECQKANS